MEEERSVGRYLISDAELNRILEELTDEYFSKSLDSDPSSLRTTLFCYEAQERTNQTRKACSLLLSGGLKPENLNRVGKKLFNTGIAPVAIFLVGFGEFFMRVVGEEDRRRPGVIIGGITTDSRSVHSHIELVHGDRHLIPIRKHLFPYSDSDTRERFNQLSHVYDGYAEFMKIGEVSGALENGFAAIPLVGKGIW